MRRRSARVAAGWTLCAIPVLVAGGSRASGEETSRKERWASLAAVTATRLHALAEWCGGKKLYGSRAEVHESILAETALRCWGTPDDVAAAAVFLASADAAFITGELLIVAGGRGMH